uniref:Reverse transcriptase Ty1/copia-type domain-containing protein n=1 Tax=Chromera velia CCMP2878 TaxID=1169474 RepID=A0A0G4HAY8_9ALVE|eukprot:Cvel_25847.t1-p1 / transcript=Cvel_25847.t1 / gene=Cvel_25847 / organism=Chromera_velia_CCMP2878 / gene_product=hypothetical protein / transcript_product=hypothetical protein / location=Cvel_scaffold2980:7834-10247(+) / protein_length=737 / sequence_SO=supercontig / SO=protein_coding / is_pseudo=false
MSFRCRRIPLPSVQTHPLGLLSSRSSSSSSLLTRRVRLPRILPPSLTSPILAKMSLFFGGMRIQAAASLVASVLSTLRVRDGLRFRHGDQTASSLLPADVCSLHDALSGAAPNFCTVRKNLLGVGPSFVFWCQKRWWRETLSSLPREPSPPTFVTLTEVFFWPAQKLCSPPIGASVVYLWNEDDEVGPGAFQAATTHIPLPRRGLTVEQLDGRAQSRTAELQSLADNDAYKRVPIAEVDAKHRRSAVPTHFVDTEKRVEEGAWTYKSRVVADGTPFFDRSEGVTTSYATASQSAIRIALAMAFAHSDFDPREIVVADVKTAYLTALRSDSLYVHPPKDHPNHGQFLWLLNRALYGLRDSGNLWDRSRNKTLAAAGWVPSSVRGMWWKWTGKPEAPTSHLLGILPTFVDDFAILPIGRSAVQLAREIAAKGGYQMKITKPKNGTLRWAGVNFNVSRDSVHIHQTEYLLSLPLPEGMGKSEDSSASAPSSAPVARDTRLDLSQGCNQLSRHSSAPTQADAAYLLSLLRYVCRTATSRILRIPRSDVPPTSSPLSTKSWSDAALGSAGNAHPQSGWLFTLKSAILHWRAFSQKRVARSSTRAELYAAHDLVDFLECLLPVLRCVWKAGVTVEVGVDSNDLLKLVSSEMPCPTERALQSVIESLQLCIIEKSPYTLVLHTLSLRDALDEASIRLSFVPSHSNVADPFTKPMSIELLLPYFASLSPCPDSVTSSPSDFPIVL